jgi:hypothetical protein
MSTLAPRDRGAWERLAASLKPEGRAFIAGRPVAARDGRVFENISPMVQLFHTWYEERLRAALAL